MLSDYEAAEIERGSRSRPTGPIVLKWLEQLLADRRERVAQIRYLRQRLNQAFRYLDGLLEGKKLPAPACPKCGKPYVRAAGLSPNGVAYLHEDGRECRS